MDDVVQDASDSNVNNNNMFVQNEQSSMGMYRRYKIIQKWKVVIRKWTHLNNFLINALANSELLDDESTPLTYSIAEQWSDDFDLILSNYHGRQLFLQFLSNEHAEENVYFWEAIEVYRTVENFEDRRLFATQIYSQFLARSAPTPVNFDSQTKRAVDEGYSKCKEDLFDTMQRHIYMLMKRDKWMRFIKSRTYRTCLVTNIPQQTVQLWTTDYRQLINNRLGKSLMSQFLDTQFARENMDFIEAVDEFKHNWTRASSDSQKNRAAMRVWKQFLDTESTTEISIDSQTRNKIVDDLKQSPVSKDVFEPALIHIHNLLEKDCFPRFVRSSTLSKFMTEHTELQMHE